jgi:hypothetical protein
MIPSWILDIFAAIMLMVAAVSAARLGAARPWRRGTRRAALTDVDVAHLLMGIAMAGQLASGLRTLPNGAWQAVFGVMTAWFAYRVVLDFLGSGVRALAGGHCAPHLVHAGAMLYMFAALSAPAARGSGGMAGGGMSGMGTLRLPFLAFLFALVLVGYSIWDLDQLSGPGASGHYSLAVARVASPGPVLAGVGAAAGPRPVAGNGAAGPDGTAAARGSVPGPAAAELPEGAVAPVTAEVPSASAPADGTGVLAPWVATGCRIAMGVTMALMLVIMI